MYRYSKNLLNYINSLTVPHEFVLNFLLIFFLLVLYFDIKFIIRIHEDELCLQRNNQVCYNSLLFISNYFRELPIQMSLNY